MNKILMIALFSAIGLLSCTTQKKAFSWLDTHPAESAKYYKDKYPYRDSTAVVVNVDTSGKNKIIAGLLGYVDSLSIIVSKKEQALKEVKRQFNEMKRVNNFSEKSINDLQEKLNAMEPVDVSVLKKDIERELKSKIPACKDSVVYVYQENTAKATHYAFLAAENMSLSETNKTLIEANKGHEKENARLSNKIARNVLIPWWFIAVVCAAALAYLFFKFKSGIIGLFSKI